MSAVPEPSGTDVNDAGVDAQWRAEFRRRIDDVRSGRVRLLTRDESCEGINAVLDEMRRGDGTPRFGKYPVS